MVTHVTTSGHMLVGALTVIQRIDVIAHALLVEDQPHPFCWLKRLL